MSKIGITEHGDPVFDLSWIPWVKANKPTILITKNPGKLFELLKQIKEPKNLIIHCTITGNGNTVIEPNVPPPEESLSALKDFVDLYGKNRIVLRIDPIFPHKEFIRNSKQVLDDAQNLLNENMCRVRISFYDNYNHSLERLSQIGIKPANKEFHLSILVRRKLWELYGKPDLCGEPGLPSIPCVSELDCKILGVKPNVSLTGQRTTCKCLSNKFELLKKTRTQCLHSCNYCYLKKDSNKTLF